MINEFGVKEYQQEFRDGTLKFGKEAGKMVFSKIDAKGKAHELSLKDIDFTAQELRQIDQSLHPAFQGTRGGFGQKGKK